MIQMNRQGPLGIREFSSARPCAPECCFFPSHQTLSRPDKASWNAR
jgi:hypothetical protein